MPMTWPKAMPVLTDEQQRVRDDFMRYWHEVLPTRYGLIERFNHGWPARHGRGARTLEIGAGLGEHIRYEQPLAAGSYHAVELRPEMADQLRAAHPDVAVTVGDCQQRLPYADGTFERVLAIHVLEHLPDLPAALREVQRVLRPGGQFVAVIPCEGGLAYGLARRVSAQRIFERRYGMSYDWFVASEHVNRPREIIVEARRLFSVSRYAWFPLLVPSVHANLVVGLVLRPATRL
jgi:SAM-dependent methyltransferase